YQYAAPGHVKFRLVDPDKEPALVEQMKITALHSVHLQYGKESFVVANPTEESVTNGIIRVSGTTKKIVYFAARAGDAAMGNQNDPEGYAGAQLGNDIVIDQVVRLFQGPTLGVQPITKTYGAHPITQNFHDYTVYPQTRTVEPDSAGKKGLTATALVKTSASSWAETKVDEVFSKNATASLE